MRTPDKIELTNVGPVEAVSIPLPKEGGITVLRGRNDCGKTYSLDAVGKLLGGEQKLTARDGQPGRGEVSMGDVTLRIGASTRLIGEATVLSIEGRLAIGELVEPRLKDPVAADKSRTKALCRLTGAEADPTVFFDAVGGRARFASVVSTQAASEQDLVEMQRMVKRDFDTAARKAEDDASKAEGEAQAAAAAIEGLDLEAECDSVALQQALETAITGAQDLRTRASEAEETSKRVVAATMAAHRALKEYKGSPVDEATKLLEDTRQIVMKADSDVANANAILIAADKKAAHAIADRNAASVQLNAAEVHAETIAKWQATIDAGKVSSPTSIEIEGAEKAVQETRQAVEQGARVRDGHIHAKRRDEARQAATAAGKEADTLKATPQLVASTAEPAVPAHMQNAMAASALFRQGAALEAAKDSGSAALYAQIQRQAVENRQRVTDQYRYLQSSSSGTVNFKDIWASFVHNTPSVITLNDKQTITPAPPSSEPEHYVETQQTLRQAMAAAMQVPYAILMGDTTSRTAATATDLTLPTFTRNIVALKQKMGEVMTQLFREMMLRTQAELLRRHRRKNKNKQKPARDVLEKKFTKETWGDLNPDAFKMSLIHNDIQDPAALAFLYVARALDYPSYIHERLSSIPFNQTQRDIIEVTVKALPDPLTDAEKLELVKAAFAQILGVASPIDARQADMETRDGMTTLSLGTRAKRKRSEQSSSRSGEVTEPTAANVRS